MESERFDVVVMDAGESEVRRSRLVGSEMRSQKGEKSNVIVKVTGKSEVTRLRLDEGEI